MKVVVLAGGLSFERDVSLSSGSVICASLRDSGYDAVLIDLYLGVPEEDTAEQFFKNYQVLQYTVPEELPDLEKIKTSRQSADNSFFGPNVINFCKYADLVFLALHGAEGENGSIQAAFDLFKIKYTGSSHVGCVLAMDKALAKEVLKTSNVNLPKTYTEENLEYPAVIKPIDGGSSVGVSIINNRAEFKQAAELARNYCQEILIEEYVDGREFSVGIIDNKALPVIGIIPKTGFYDYKNKYQKDLTEEICPANLTEQLKKDIQDQALIIHQMLKLGSYSRIDFILGKDNKFYFLEANTLPGMTPTSLFPQEAKAAGIEFPELLKLLIDLAK